MGGIGTENQGRWFPKESRAVTRPPREALHLVCSRHNPKCLLHLVLCDEATVVPCTDAEAGSEGLRTCQHLQPSKRRSMDSFVSDRAGRRGGHSL